MKFYDEAIAKIGGFILIGVIMFALMQAMGLGDTFGGVSEISETYQFNGTLGMVDYGHSFFGLGGVDRTTLTFQNGSEIVTFNFNKDLSVNIGQNYTVSYTETTTTYYNVSATRQILFWTVENHRYQNSTTLTVNSVIVS